MTKHIDTKDQAVMIRKDLKAAFPGTTFSVRIDRYSMGSSVHVKWEDGPTEKDVRGVTDYYEARGMVDQTDYWPHRILTLSTGEQVSFGGSVSERREYTLPFVQQVLNEVARQLGVPRVTVVRSKWGSVEAPGARSIKVGFNSDLEHETWLALRDRRGPGVKVGTVVRPAVAAVREV